MILLYFWWVTFHQKSGSKFVKNNNTDIVDIENYIAFRGYEIKKVDKKTKKTDKNIIAFGAGYHFNLKTQETFYQNQKLKLTKKESLFLKLLLINIRQVVTFAQATNYIWNKEELITQNNL